MLTELRFISPFVIAIIVYCNASAATTSTFDRVYQALQNGYLTEAQAMIEVVLRDDPNNAAAHFIDAQILVQQGRLDYATTELQTARRLSPDLPFAKPSAITTLEAQLRKIDIAATSSELLRSEYRHVRYLLWVIVIFGIGMTSAIILATRRSPRATLRSTSGGATPSTDEIQP